MAFHLIEYQTGKEIRIASYEDRENYSVAKRDGKEYIVVGYFGYTKKAIVKEIVSG